MLTPEHGENRPLQLQLQLQATISLSLSLKISGGVRTLSRDILGLVRTDIVPRHLTTETDIRTQLKDIPDLTRTL